MQKQQGRAFDALAVGVLLCIAVIAASTFRDYGLGWDDYTHSQYGELLLKFYSSGFTDRRALSFVNLYMYGGGFDMSAAALHKVLPFGLFETRRLCGAVVGLIGFFVTWRIGRRVGGPLAGLCALLLLASWPLYYGHMFMNAKDAPFATAMAILLLALLRAFEDYPRPGATTIALFGLGLGLAIGSRVLGGLAALYVIAPMALIFVTQIRDQGVRRTASDAGLFLLRLLPGFVLAYMVMALIWPWSVLEPLNPFRAVGYFSHFFEKPWKEMYEGMLISVPDMPRSYVPVHFFLKTPELLLLLFIGALVAIGIGAAKGQTPKPKLVSYLLIVSAALIPIVVAVVTRPAMYNGIRHFVFVSPPIAILGGLAAEWAFERAAQISRTALAGAATLFLIGIADPVVAMVRLHPYQYTHFNHIAGGLEGADERFMLDYWGLAFKEASRQLREKLTAQMQVPPDHRRWRIAVCGPHPAAEVELGPEFVTTWDPKGADFAMMLGEFYCAKFDAPVLAEVKREDVVFARVYDIRGRDISTLFTIPPVR
jgi:hypothetical protein